MITFKKLKIKNFLSFGNKITELDLSEEKSTLIVGENMDIGDSGESRNGAGKTTAFQAIVFALYGKGFDKLKTDEFINLVNEKNLLVELEFDVNGTPYRIVRQRKPNSVELFSGDVSLTRDSMANTDKAIIELIHDIPHHVFLGIFALTPHLEPFMSMSTSEQRNFIESLLSLDVLAARAETLKIIRKEQQIDIKIAEEKLNTIRHSNQSINDKIERLTVEAEEWETERNSRIDSLEQQLSEFENFDGEEITSGISILEKLNAELEKQQKEVDEVSAKRNQLSDPAKLIRKLSEVESTLVRLTENTELHKSTIAAMEDNLRTKKENYGNIEQLRQLMENNNQQELLFDELERKLDSVLSDIKNYTVKKQSAEKKLELLVSEVESLTSGVCPYCKQSHFDNDKVQLLLSNIDELEGEILNLDKKTKDAENELEKVKEQKDNITIDGRNFDGMIREIERIEMQIDMEKSRHSSQQQELNQQLNGLTNNRGLEYYDELKKSLVDVEDEHKKIKELENDVANKLIAIRSKISAHSSTLKFKTMDSFFLYKSKIDKVRLQLSNVKKEENPYLNKIDALETTIVDEDELKKSLEDLTKIEKHTGYLIKLLTDPKSFVRKNILDQYVPIVNKKILENTAKLGLGHICTINSDLSVDVSYMSRPVSYYNLSQGERLRLNLAVSSAFRYLMSLLGKTTNLILVDEYLDSALDPSGMRSAFEFIKSQSKSVWIISHKDELKGQTDRTMTVVKRNGFSSIEK